MKIQEDYPATQKSCQRKNWKTTSAKEKLEDYSTSVA